jgi:hypothetical protein
VGDVQAALEEYRDFREANLAVSAKATMRCVDPGRAELASLARACGAPSP